MGNEHVTDKQLKNSVFTVFGVIKEIIRKLYRLKNMDSAGNFCGVFSEKLYHNEEVSVAVGSTATYLGHFVSGWKCSCHAGINVI